MFAFEGDKKIIQDEQIKENSKKGFAIKIQHYEEIEKKSGNNSSRVILNPNHQYSKNSMKKIKSKRKYRRYENLCFLLSLFERENLDLDDGYYMDLYDRDSAFTRLFFDRDQLQAWVEFISKSGQEQEDYLDSLDGDLANLSIDDEHCDLQEDFVILNEEHEEPEVRKIFKSKQASLDDDYHDLRYGDLCFKKIDNHIKPVFKKDASLKCLENYEEKIIDYFHNTKSNDDVLYVIDEFMAGFDRMILHGLCQYLDLRSLSYHDSHHGQKRFQIRLKCNKKFRHPVLLLSTYVRIKFLQK